MNSLTVVLFLVFELFSNILVQWMHITTLASPLDRSYLDYLVWESATWSGFARIFAFGTRIVTFAFLIYLGFVTVWYWPICLYAVVLPVTILLHTVIRKMWGLTVPGSIGLAVIPIVGIGMWFTVR
jgi:hypothetical protein